MELNANNVRSVFMDCLYTSKEEYDNNPESGIRIEGITSIFILNKDKLEKHRNEIISMLDQLPPAFRASEITNGGGGWSFIQMPFKGKDNDNLDQWGEQPNAQELMLLGMGIGVMAYLIKDREIWRIMPGGVPYIVYNPKGFDEE